MPSLYNVHAICTDHTCMHIYVTARLTGHLPYIYMYMIDRSCFSSNETFMYAQTSAYSAISKHVVLFRHLEFAYLFQKLCSHITCSHASSSCDALKRQDGNGRICFSFFARVEICTFHDEDIVHENMLQTLLALSELPYRKWHRKQLLPNRCL